jgi:transposase
MVDAAGFMRHLGRDADGTLIGRRGEALRADMEGDPGRRRQSLRPAQELDRLLRAGAELAGEGQKRPSPGTVSRTKSSRSGALPVAATIFSSSRGWSRRTPDPVQAIGLGDTPRCSSRDA